MVWFFGMQLLPLGYCFAYLVFSLRRRRFRQALSVGILTAAEAGALALLLWEFLAMP